MRRILHVDMDAFFAAVELLRHPEWRGKPLVVGGRGDPRQRGVVSTASYEARRFGIRSGMPLRTAYARCPQAIFLPVDYAAYAAVSERIKAILGEFSPIMEDVGIDEAFLDITATPGSAAEIARAIKGRIREETGLGCSIGVGPNKLLAKIASDMDKPDGFTSLGPQDIETRVWPLAVRKLWGVGPKTEGRLARLGVRSIGDLARMSLETLVGNFGQAHGRYLHQAARGIDESPLVTYWEPKSLGRETTFQHDISDRNTLIRVLARLTGELVTRLRKEGYTARQVVVKLRFADFDTHTHAVTLPMATDDLESIRKAALDGLQRFSLEKRVRLLGVRLAGLARGPAPR